MFLVLRELHRELVSEKFGHFLTAISGRTENQHSFLLAKICECQSSNELFIARNKRAFLGYLLGKLATALFRLGDDRKATFQVAHLPYIIDLAIALFSVERILGV